jgi:hypothetical protein
MQTLPPNWLTEGLIDFEYKQYVLLAYLKHVQQCFAEQKLYPQLSDLVFHYQNLQTIRSDKQLLYENFPKKVSRADFEKLHLTYEKMVQDDRLMAELDAIMEFAMPKLQDTLKEGKDVYEYVEENLDISPVGLASLRTDEGYLFLYQTQTHDTRVYHYQISLFESASEKYRGVYTSYLETVRKSVNVTFETLKVEVSRKHRLMAHPATYLVRAQITCPLDETLLPVAKRMLIRYISTT